MRKSHIYLFAVAAVTVGLVATAPVAANTSSAITTIAVQASGELGPDQKAEFDIWSSEKQAEYELWPAETQSYYWSLTPDRQMVFWRLSDEDKIAITAMTGPEREAAWGRIESRASNPPPEG